MSNPQGVLSLYRRIRRAHRMMPVQLRILGDQYVRDEFKRHKSAQPEYVSKFLGEWERYATDLEHQLSEGAHAIGKTLTDDDIDLLSAEQLGQLSVLREEAEKPAGDSSTDPSR